MSVLSVVKASIKEQKKEVALKNCFSSWSGEIDEDIILQGIFDRYKAMGTPLAGLRIERKSLKEVKVMGVAEGSELVKTIFTVLALNYKSNTSGFTEFKTATGFLSCLPRDGRFFHPSELETLSRWLMENAYSH